MRNNTRFFSQLITLIIICLLAINTAQGQSRKAVKEIDHAKQALRDDNYDRAWEHIKKALKHDEDYFDALMMAGDFQMYKENAKAAIPYYEKALRVNGSAYIKYKLAIAYRDDTRYDNAVQMLREYEQQRNIPSDRQAEFYLLLSSVEFAAEAIKNPVDFNPIDLGPMINTEAMEYFPSINAKGDELVFTSRMTEGPKQDEDFFISLLENEKWQRATRLEGFLNTRDNEGAQSLSADGTELFFAGCHRQDGFGSCDLYVSKLIDGLWSAPKNLGQAINSGNWESQPSISPDGKTLYFVRGKSGYTTNTTIMQSTRNADGSWTKAEPAAGEINTPYEDASPFIHFDNQTLYFTSNGHPGMGRKDVYYSRKKPDGTWGTPINLGYPINTPFDEFSLVVHPNGQTAYFASNRTKGGEDLDIFEFELPSTVRAIATTYVIGKIVDKESGTPIKTQVEFYDLNNNSAFQTLQSNENGEFFGVMPKDRSFALFIDEKNYLPFSENYDLNGVDQSENYRLKVMLTPIKPGTKFTLTNVLFDTDKFTLKAESKAELDRLVNFLKTNNTLKATLVGHTDNQGAKEHNQQLSENRAKAVVDYLIAHGIDTKRLSWQGKGDTQPIADNTTAQGRKQNRRTEVILK